MKHLLTSVVREICTLRSVGAGARATALGHPVGTGQLVSLPRLPTICVHCTKLTIFSCGFDASSITVKAKAYEQTGNLKEETWQPQECPNHPPKTQ